MHPYRSLRINTRGGLTSLPKVGNTENVPEAGVAAIRHPRESRIAAGSIMSIPETKARLAAKARYSSQTFIGQAATQF